MPRFAPLLGALSALSAVALFATPALAQNPPAIDPATGISVPCLGEPFRAFDYWLGSWIVRNEAGQEMGRNRITRVSQGCALLEEWTPGNGGPKGSSLNFHDPSTGRWHQVWMGGVGQVLRLEGGIEDGAMTLTGSRTGPAGALVRDRIRWIRLDDGRVEQRWESLTAPSEEWQVTFRGFYEKVPE